MLETKLETQPNIQQARTLVQGIMRSQTQDITQLNYDMNMLHRQLRGTHYQDRFGTIYQLYKEGEVITNKAELNNQLKYIQNYLSN